LPFPEDVVEAFVDFGTDVLSFCDRIGSFCAHNAGYFLQKQFVFAFYFHFSELLDHFPFAMVDDYGFCVFHEFGVDGFDFFEVDGVVGVFDFLFFDLDKLIHVRSDPVHVFDEK